MRRQTPEINAGSMADIAFLLLIFWLVATSLKPDRGLPGFLENADDKTKIAVPTRASDILRVHVTSDGTYEIDGEEYSLSELEQKFLILNQTSGFKGKLVVTADYDAPYEEYTLLLLSAQELKLKTIENEIHEETK